MVVLVVGVIVDHFLLCFAIWLNSIRLKAQLSKQQWPCDEVAAFEQNYSLRGFSQAKVGSVVDLSKPPLVNIYSSCPPKHKITKREEFNHSHFVNMS